MTPQAYLDEFHKVNVPALFDPSMSARARADAIRDARQQLSKLKVRLQDERDTLRNQEIRKKSDDKTIQRTLAPYNMLQNLLLELDTQVQHLQDTLGAGKLLPKPPEFGDYIFGAEETGEWQIGYAEDYNRWDDMMQTKQRLTSFLKEREPLKQQLDELKDEVTLLQNTLQKGYEQIQEASVPRIHLDTPIHWFNHGCRRSSWWGICLPFARQSSRHCWHRLGGCHHLALAHFLSTLATWTHPTERVHSI